MISKMRFWAILPCLLLICLIGTGVAEIEDRSRERLENDFGFSKEDTSDEVGYSAEHDEVGLLLNGMYNLMEQAFLWVNI